MSAICLALADRRLQTGCHEKLGWGDIQRGCNPDEIEYGQIALAALDAAHVAAVNAGCMGKSFLGHAKL
ncbi:hypothetical protein AWV79_07625 [Cupriavidus sp. UYMMa02A]|nr:hypothetical protein AWV79_07625 [Cupriavidus sp. UYMMa02A]